MAVAYSRTRSATLPERTYLSLSRLVMAVVHWNEARQTRAILSKLSHRELEDIGLSRGDIDAIGKTR